jgi:putative phosphoribosyl transferase
LAFKGRTDAGRKLAQALVSYRDQRPVVFALPRGGVVVAAEVALALRSPLDVLLVRKIGVPQQPELAMGAVVDGGPPLVVRNEDVINVVDVSESEFEMVCGRQLAEIERRRKHYLGDREPVDATGRTAIIIDDGIATGATVRAAVRATRLRKPAKLVLAVPVAPTDTIAQLRAEADDVVCLEEHAFFGAIGFYYSDFRQVSDKKVIDTLKRFRTRPTVNSDKPAA